MTDFNFKGDKETQDSTGSFYTPGAAIDIMFEHVDSFKHRTFFDPTVGGGNILIHVLERKLEEGESASDAITEIYGVELLPESHANCINRLLEWANEHDCTPESIAILKSHIVCSDIYDWDIGNWCQKANNIALF